MQKEISCANREKVCKKLIRVRNVCRFILGKLSENGWNSYRLRKEKALSESVITSIRNRTSITINTIDKICELCDCQPGDLMHYVKNEQGE